MYLRFGPPNVRVISRIESEDFLHWSPKVTVVRKSKLDTPFSTELHTMGAMPYHGIYIGVFNTYHGETTKPIPDDQRIGLLLDITVWPITGTNAEAARQLYAVQDRFGMEDVRFSGYWNNADLIGGQTNEIKASTYRKPRGGALVVVFNTAREARAAAQRRLGSIEVGRPARGFRRLYADARRGEREGRHA